MNTQHFFSNNAGRAGHMEWETPVPGPATSRSLGSRRIVPPHFTIEGNRGYLFYPQQPPFCKLCLGRGHTADACTNIKCRNCLDKGHMAKDCTRPRRCKICGGDNHLARACPQYKPLYSDTLVQIQPQGTQVKLTTKGAGSAVAPETLETRPPKRKGEMKNNTTYPTFS
uniref:CCHC-type domain-containing protein n=1 Tax=Denticeps clupeoides TaxID=299321 RepID=A0AAY4B6W1_9TELE